MNPLNNLIEIIALYNREAVSESKYNSNTLLIKAIDTIEENDSKDVTNFKTTIPTLISYVREIVTSDDEEDVPPIYSMVSYITLLLLDGVNVNESLTHTMISNSIKPEEDIIVMERTIKSLRASIHSFVRVSELKLLSREINRGISKGAKSKELLENARERLSQLEDADTVKDGAIVSEIILDSKLSEEEAGLLFDRIVERTVYKLGLDFINVGAQGGVRSGETLTIGALSHHNKTGVLIASLGGACFLNKFPIVDGRKPLLQHISFEDPETTVVSKYYETFVATFNDGLENPSLADKAMYIEKKIAEASGGTLALGIVYVDPTKWGYGDIKTYIMNLKSRGYYIPICAIDYLDKVSNMGLSMSGPMGSEKRELLRKTKNFMYREGIAFMTPWQLSSKANDMVTNGMDPLHLPDFAAGKSLYQGNSTLDTDIDLEVLVSKGKFRDESYMAMAIGKHRLDTVIDEKFKRGFYKFPQVGPIPMDAVIHKSAHKKKLFDFGGSDDSMDSIF